MPDLGRGLGSEIPRVSDNVPKEVKKKLKGVKKATLAERLNNVLNTEEGFEAMHIPER